MLMHVAFLNKASATILNGANERFYIRMYSQVGIELGQAVEHFAAWLSLFFWEQVWIDTSELTFLNQTLNCFIIAVRVIVTSTLSWRLRSDIVPALINSFYSHVMTLFKNIHNKISTAGHVRLHSHINFFHIKNIAKLLLFIGWSIGFAVIIFFDIYFFYTILLL